MVLHHKIIEYGLYIVVFLLPWQTRWMAKPGVLNAGYWEYGTYSVYMVDVAIIVILLYCYIVFLLRRDFRFHLPAGLPAGEAGEAGISDLRIRRSLLLVVILGLFTFISIFFAVDWRLALYGYGVFLLGVGLFFLATRRRYDILKLYGSIALAGTAQSLMAVWQVSVQSVYANKWLGMAAQKAEEAGVSVIETLDERWLRAYGSLPHPNILGGFLAVSLICNIALYYGLWRKFTLSQSLMSRLAIVASLAGIAIITAGLMLTFSRSAWLGFAAGLAVYWLAGLGKYYREKKGSLQIVSLVKATIIIVIVSAGTAWLFRAPLATRVQGDGRLEQASMHERLDSYRESRQVIAGNWLFGVGIKNYGLAVYAFDNQRPAYAYQPAHNVFLLVWSETGLFGFICFIVLLFYFFYNTWQARNQECMALFVTVIVLMLFDHWLWSLHFGILLFWLILGVGMRLTFNHSYAD